MSETVIVALGTNLGDRHKNLINAKKFLSGLALSPLHCSSIYETEPIGPSQHYYLNAVIQLETKWSASQLINLFKNYERAQGRDMKAPRWSDRIIDLDIIAYGQNVFSSGILRIPHPEYPKRRFVLLPLEEINSNWTDPVSGRTIEEMITAAQDMFIRKTDLQW